MYVQDKKIECRFCFSKAIQDVLLSANYLKFKCYTCKRQSVLEINILPYMKPNN